MATGHRAPDAGPVWLVTTSAPVLHARSGDRTVLLDVASGRYILLEPVASATWHELVKGEPITLALANLIKRFDVEVGRLAADFGAFAAECRLRGWLAATSSADQPAQFRRRRVLLPVLAACTKLLGVRRRLRQCGFQTAYRWAIDLHSAAPRDAGSTVLYSAERAFRLAEALLPGGASPDDCLPRSLALFAFLRQMGLPASHRIGIEQVPFCAHAWVECHGRVILDRDRRAELLVLSSPATCSAA